MITDSEFAAFVHYVTERLRKEQSFIMPRDEFVAFGFQRPFYTELCKRVGASDDPFLMQASYVAADGDPSHVEFTLPRP